MEGKAMSLEEARELKQTVQWTRVINELDHRIYLQLQKLRHADHGELRDIQQTIQLIEEIKSLPEDVISREEPAEE